MKKLLSILLITAMVLSFAPAVMAADGIPVYLNGEKIEKDGIIVNDRTFLPVRALSEALGYTVDWVDGTKSVIIGTAPEETVKTDKVNIYLEGVKMENAEAIIVHDSTFLPVMLFAKHLIRTLSGTMKSVRFTLPTKRWMKTPSAANTSA